MAGLSTSPIKNFSHAVAQRVINVVPKVTVGSRRINQSLTWIGENISSPENRLILGISALMSQPFIDLNNKKVDEDTRKISALRTIAKIIAGTTTGVIIRYGCIKAINSFTKLPEDITESMKHKKLRQLFTPSPEVVKFLQKNLGQYKKSLGTILAVTVMCFTNFLIDAPLTKFLTNKFLSKARESGAIKDIQPHVAANDKKVKEVANE